MIDLAFGEFSETEAVELETRASADPIAAKQLQELRSLKSDLKALSDIPPHQLSNDRLRDAILGQGLKPKSVFDWSWIWMPALSCTLVAGLLFGLRHRPSAELNFVGPQVASTVEPPSKFFHIVEAPSIVKTTPDKPKSLTLVTVRHPANRHFATRGHHGRTWFRRHEFNEKLVALWHPGGDVLDDGGVTQVPTGGATAGLKPVDNKPSSPEVVVILPSRDRESGTQQAEVGSGKNVVVGG